MSAVHKTYSTCLNCNGAIEKTDKYCAHCGQENRDLKISFWELITEFLSSNFNFDTKLGRTLVDLLFKPGEITRQFNLGKRVRYVRPVQMYLFVSFIYFLLIGLEPASFVNTTPPSQEQLTAINESNIAEVNINGTQLEAISERFKAADPENDAEIDSLLTELGEKELTSWKRHLAKQAIKSLNPKNDNALTQEIYANLSIALLFLLPVFALLLWVFTKKHAPFFMDSLVFSIHFNSVALIILSINMVVAMLFDEATVFKIALATTLCYLILALKRVFEFSWLRSIGNAFGISILYSMVFGLSYLLVVILSFWIY